MIGKYHLKAIGTGCMGAIAAGSAIFMGSRGLVHFDPELTFYAVGTILTVFAIGYRFALWAQRPPTRVYLLAGLRLMSKRFKKTNQTPSLVPEITIATTEKIVAQSFIRRRSLPRWIMHLCLSGGCTLAFAITFPLVFGWVYFSSTADNAALYRVLVFGIPVDSFSIHSFKGFLFFNALNISAVIVGIGLVMAFVRRLTDPGERATQKFTEDFVPLLLILAVTVTGLGLTVSYKLMAGAGHHPLAFVHCGAVIALLFYIPFGKLFHMFQRLASVCVSLYQREAAEGPQATCARCAETFASEMQISDLKSVLADLGFDYRYGSSTGLIHYQHLCPPCRRRLVALNQGQSIGR